MPVSIAQVWLLSLDFHDLSQEKCRQEGRRKSLLRGFGSFKRQGLQFKLTQKVRKGDPELLRKEVGSSYKKGRAQQQYISHGSPSQPALCAVNEFGGWAGVQRYFTKGIFLRGEVIFRKDAGHCVTRETNKETIPHIEQLPVHHQPDDQPNRREQVNRGPKRLAHLVVLAKKGE